MEGSPFMKALRDFAMANPEDCDREWDAYLATVNRKGSTSSSPSTNSTSPLRHRAPAAAVMAPATAPLSSPSGAASSHCFHGPCPRSTATLDASASPNLTKDDLSPGARRMYDYLIGATDSFHEPTASTSPPISALAVSRARPGEEDSLTRNASTTIPTSTASLYAPSSSAKDGLSPEARSIYDYTIGASAPPTPDASEVSTVLQDPTISKVAPIAVDINAHDLATKVSTSCSSKCPSQEATVSMSVLISSATTTSLVAPMVGDMAHDVDATSDISTALQVPTHPNVVHDVVDNPGALIPTCSVKCPSREASVLLFVLTPLAAPSQSMATSADVSKLTEYTEKCNSISCHRNDDVLTSPPLTMTTSAGLEPRPVSWPSFDYNQFGTPLWYAPVREKISRFMRNLMGRSTSGDDTQFCDVRLCSHISAIDWDHKAQPTIGYMIIDANIEHDVASECTVRIRCSSIPDDALVDRVSVTLPEFVVRLVLSRVNFGGALHMHAQNQEAPWYHSCIEFGPDCPLDVVFGCLIIDTYLKHIWPTPGAQNQELITTGTLLGKMQLMRMKMLWQVHGKPKFGGRIKVVKIKLPWPPPIRMCTNLPMGNLPNSTGRVSVIFLCNASWFRYLSKGNSVDEPKPPRSLPAPTITPMHITNIYLELNQFGVSAIHGSKSYGWFGFERKLTGQRLYLLLGLYSSCDQFITDYVTYFHFQLFEWHIPWDSCSARGHWKLNFALLFSWDVTSTIDSVPGINSNSGMFSQPLQVLELGNYFAMAILLFNSHQSEAWVLYIPATSIMHCGYKLMLLEISSSKDGILTYPIQVLISWDPGGSYPDHPNTATGINWKSTQLSFLHLTWDPGGYTRLRLEGKPNFKEGGLSATYLLGWSVGRYSWAIACSAARQWGSEKHIYQEDSYTRRRLGTERTGKRLRPRPGLACVTCVAWFSFFLLDPIFFSHCSPEILASNLNWMLIEQ